MKHTILTHRDLLNWTEQLSIKPAASIQAICAGILLTDAFRNEPMCRILIGMDLMSKSYKQVPAMFAVTIKRTHDFGYTHISSKLSFDHFIIEGTMEQRSRSFRARVREFLEYKDQYTISKDKVPMSYRRQPSLLSKGLTLDLGTQVCNRCNTSNITWFIDKSAK